MSNRERCAQACCLCAKVCRIVLRVRWNLVFIGVEHSNGSLFVGVVIAFADNSWLIDNSR